MKNFNFMKIIFLFTILCLIHLNIYAEVTVNTPNFNSNKASQVKNNKKKGRVRVTKNLQIGSKGGCFYRNRKGNKVYVSRSLCK